MPDHLGVTARKSGNDLEPLAVSPRQACLLLGMGNTRLYQLIGTGELVAYKDGRSRRVTMASIKARVASLASAPDQKPRLRRRGGPPKSQTAQGPEAAA